MEQRTLKIGDLVIYCYEDGSFEWLSEAHIHIKNPLVRTFGSKGRGGYRCVRLKINGKQQTLRVHRLIALAFHSNPNNLPQVDHINRNREDNRPCNLRWVSAKENSDNQHSVENSIAKYGVRECEDKKAYTKAYQEKALHLIAVQPSGKGTKYSFQSSNDPLYQILKPLSQKERYFKHEELRRKAK